MCVPFGISTEVRDFVRDTGDHFKDYELSCFDIKRFRERMKQEGLNFGGRWRDMISLIWEEITNTKEL